MEVKPKVSVEQINRRLRRIGGQLRGIERMLEQDACCSDLLVQIAAVRAAVSKVGVLILKSCPRLPDRVAGQNDEEARTLETC